MSRKALFLVPVLLFAQTLARAEAPSSEETGIDQARAMITRSKRGFDAKREELGLIKSSDPKKRTEKQNLQAKGLEEALAKAEIEFTVGLDKVGRSAIGRLGVLLINPEHCDADGSRCTFRIPLDKAGIALAQIERSSLRRSWAKSSRSEASDSEERREGNKIVESSPQASYSVAGETFAKRSDCERRADAALVKQVGASGCFLVRSLDEPMETVIRDGEIVSHFASREEAKAYRSRGCVDKPGIKRAHCKVEVTERASASGGRPGGGAAVR